MTDVKLWLKVQYTQCLIWALNRNKYVTDFTKTRLLRTW